MTNKLYLSLLLALYTWMLNAQISEQTIELYTDSLIPTSSSIALSDTSALYHPTETDYFYYTSPSFGGTLTNIFRNLYELPSFAFRQETIYPWIAIGISTGILYYYDKPILDAAQKFGSFIGIPGEDNKQVNIFTESLPINVPGDLGFALYFIGDGITELMINAGFYSYGLAANDIRALSTAAQLTEGLAVTGIVIQTLKRTTGRQSPFVVDQNDPERGSWELFPNQIDYQNNVPSYDAFPSGHLATAMMTFTVISENYPEYKWISPLGYTLMSLLSFQMLNNGVHWASDYPLAIGIGYSIGKLAVLRARYRATTNTSRHATAIGSLTNNLIITPAMGKNTIGMGILYRF